MLEESDKMVMRTSKQHLTNVKHITTSVLLDGIFNFSVRYRKA